MWLSYLEPAVTRACCDKAPVQSPRQQCLAQPPENAPFPTEQDGCSHLLGSVKPPKMRCAMMSDHVWGAMGDMARRLARDDAQWEARRARNPIRVQSRAGETGRSDMNSADSPLIPTNIQGTASGANLAGEIQCRQQSRLDRTRSRDRTRSITEYQQVGFDLDFA